MSIRIISWPTFSPRRGSPPLPTRHPAGRDLVTPNAKVSEHPPSLVSAGETFVTGVTNAVMSGPYWKSSAIFVAWDDWGGFYDHVVPPLDQVMVRVVRRSSISPTPARDTSITKC